MNTMSDPEEPAPPGIPGRALRHSPGKNMGLGPIEFAEIPKLIGHSEKESVRIYPNRGCLFAGNRWVGFERYPLWLPG